MYDAALASVFVLMLITPCALAVFADRRREQEFEAALAEPKSEEPLAVEAVTVQEEAPVVVEAIEPLPDAVPVEVDEIDVQDVPVEWIRTPRSQSRTATFLQQRAERAQFEALVAQAAAAKADAMALMALARAAAAKADAAAELAEIAAREVEEAAYVAATVRESYARDAQGAGPKSALPETHPSLDFPRSRVPRRAA